MTKQEKLVLLLVSLFVLSKLSSLGKDIYLAYTYGPHIPVEVEYSWKKISILLSGFVNIGAAIWLYLEAKVIEAKAWIWALLGLFFGVIGLVLFYVIKIYARRRTDVSRPTDQ